jgi:hypothetical protein
MKRGLRRARSGPARRLWGPSAIGGHVAQHPQARGRRQARDDRDRAAVPEGVRDGAGDQRAQRVARVAPEAIDPDDGRARDRRDRVGHRGDQRRVDQRGAQSEQCGGGGGDGDRAAAERQQRERTGLHEHAGDDQGLASGGVRPVPGGDLGDAPHAGIDRGDQSDLRGAGAVRGEEQRHEPPGEAVVEVVDQAGLRAGAQRGDAVGGAGERLAQPRWVAVGRRVMGGLLQRDVRRGVTHEDHREQQRGHRDHGARHDEHVARGELGGQDAAEAGGQRDAAVARGLVEAERQPAAPRANQVDLHHHGHGPRQALVDAQQDVGRDDPAPARRHGDQQRDGQRHGPAGDQQAPPSGALRERSRAEVRERLGETEGDDERQHRGAGAQVELLAADKRQRRALEADHRADERVDGHQQRELRGVLAQPEADLRAAHATSASGRPARLAATIAACCSGLGGMSCTRAFTKASSSPCCSATLWRRSKPIVEAGLADRPRPQTEPE